MDKRGKETSGIERKNNSRTEHVHGAPNAYVTKEPGLEPPASADAFLEYRRLECITVACAGAARLAAAAAAAAAGGVMTGSVGRCSSRPAAASSSATLDGNALQLVLHVPWCVLGEGKLDQGTQWHSHQCGGHTVVVDHQA